MTQAEAYFDALSTYHHSTGKQRQEALGRIINFALHGKGEVRKQARAVLELEDSIVWRGV